MYELLSDRSTYEIIEPRVIDGKVVDINLAVQRKVNNFITKLENLGQLTKGEAKSLRTYNSVLGRAYGLYKVHKDGNPLRPIVSCIDTSCYKLAKFFTDILNNIVGKTERHVLNSQSFKECIDDLFVSRTYRLLSLDVRSLFTNIPLDLILYVVTARWNTLRKYTSLTLESFTEGLTLIYNSCYFTFKGVVYRQIYGTPMGSPVSPPLANLVMEFVESEVLEELRNEGVRILEYGRYIDDTFLIAPARHVPKVVEKFNSKHPRLEFTTEEEIDGSLPFLDVKVIRQEDGSLCTRWYRKPTWSGRYMSFDSQLPLAYKRNTISLLTRKVHQLSDPKFHQEDFALVSDTLVNNGYPKNFVSDTMNQTLEKLNGSTPPPVADTNNDMKFCSIPYIPNVFHKIKNTMSDYGVRIVGRAAEPISFLYHQLKDRVPKRFQSNVCYEISCECSKKYIGQTSQHLQERLSQHMKKGPEHSALSAHLHENGCSISIDNVKILCHETNRKTREVKEAIYIKSSENINTQHDNFDLGHQYDNLVN